MQTSSAKIYPSKVADPYYKFKFKSRIFTLLTLNVLVSLLTIRAVED